MRRRVRSSKLDGHVTVQRRHSAKREARRQRLIDAARSAFLTKGFDATTIDDIVSVSGGSRGTLYIYFGGKPALYEAVVKREAVRLVETLSAALSDASELSSFLTAVMDVATGEKAIALLRLVIVRCEQHHAIPDIFRQTIPILETLTVNHLWACVDFPQLPEPMRHALADALLMGIAQAQLSKLTGIAGQGDEAVLSRQVIRHLTALIAAFERATTDRERRE
ncbi:TetR/AcrR family transcriptional regulator [Sphingobium sp. CCH11-B1]|uniref:TetR/AcrR family transcriptional regulator n=1 Tax=Sphingobium sp. CCH11-B1 TaxID=1768781 RepID=UPI0009E759DD|nr:TetR/AcrR family transcriptional regulator [Sphingobium sp. CCH11-B1]